MSQTRGEAAPPYWTDIVVAVTSVAGLMFALAAVAVAFIAARAAFKTNEQQAKQLTQLEADARSQWRPVIIPQPDPPRFVGEQISLDITNAGPGPAFFVRVKVDPSHLNHYQRSAIAVLQPGTDHELRIDRPGEYNPAQILLDYRDMTGRSHTTSITIFEGATRTEPHTYDVRVWQEHTATQLGDATYPQPGLDDASPTVG